jgi:hypothetical protein
MTYAEKLKHPKWQRKRLEIMQRDDFTCQKCGDDENTLHVHHKKYKKGKEPWDYNDNDLITLCEKCHKKGIEDNNSGKYDEIIMILEMFDDERLEFLSYIINDLKDFNLEDFNNFITALQHNNFIGFLKFISSLTCAVERNNIGIFEINERLK